MKRAAFNAVYAVKMLLDAGSVKKVWGIAFTNGFFQNPCIQTVSNCVA